MDNNISYAKKLALLEKECREIDTKNIIQFNINDKQYFIKRGNSNKGFEHILLRHYGQECEGKLTARNILNMATTIKMGSIYQSERNDYLSISNTFNNERFVIVLSKDKNGH